MFRRWGRKPATSSAAVADPPQPELWTVAPAQGLAVLDAPVPPPVVPAAPAVAALVAVLEAVPAITPTVVSAPLCPRCHGTRVGEKESAARMPVCAHCMTELGAEVADEREADYLANYLHTRQGDSDHHTERLRAQARQQGVHWQAPRPPMTDKARMATRLKPYRQAGTVDVASEDSAEDEEVEA